MRQSVVTIIIFTVIFVAAFSVNLSGREDQNTSHSAVAPSNRVARGKYIVEGMARCAQCHTPRNSDGTLDVSHPLEGAALWLMPASNTSNATDWPLVAPRIAGTLPASDQDMIRLLTTGIWTDGKPLRAPMPQFRMTTEDAEAVVAFLHSL